MYTCAENPRLATSYVSRPNPAQGIEFRVFTGHRRQEKAETFLGTELGFRAGDARHVGWWGRGKGKGEGPWWEGAHDVEGLGDEGGS